MVSDFTLEEKLVKLDEWIKSYKSLPNKIGECLKNLIDIEAASKHEIN